MVLRLSELLDRIRPAGAPGTAAAAVPQRDVAAHQEIAQVVHLLAEFEAEADATVAAARDQAEAITADADRTARQIRSELPDRLARARAEVAEDTERAGVEAIAGIAADAAVQAAAIRAAAGFDHIVDRVIAEIWKCAHEEPVP